MSIGDLENLGIEAERYELFEGPRRIGRREFLRRAGGGLVVLCLAAREASGQRESGGRRRSRGGRLPREISAWIQIDEEGKVCAFTGKAELGQNIRTSLSQAVADELRMEPGEVDLVMGDTARVPFDNGTFGSRTTPTMAPQLRKAAAAARERLVGLAADLWKVDRGRVEVRDGQVKERNGGRSAGFAELTRGKPWIGMVEEDSAVTPASEWTVAGRSVAKINGRDFVTGRHRYTSDQTRPGMLFGRVLRPPVFGAELVKLDSSAAEAMPGVVVVRDGAFVGVAAPDEATASKAVRALRAEWSGGAETGSNEDLFDRLKKTADRDPRGGEGPADKAPEAGGVSLTRTYTVEYIAHAPLEPRAAVAEWEGDRLTVWSGTQRPFGVREELVRAFDLPEENVRVIVPDTGAGYGGKHTGEVAVEAARLSKAAGRPVKLVWTRREEFTWAYFRPAGVIEATVSASKDGMLTSWSFHNINSGGSGVEPPYRVEGRRVGFLRAKSPLRQGSYRALASSANHFARESLIDELASELKIDPLEFRLRNLDDDRVCSVLKAAAERFGWDPARNRDGRGIGIAGGVDKGGHIATCAEVDTSGGTVRVVRLVSAFDCGAVVNPDGLRNQIEGAMMMGLGGALFEAIRFADGKVLSDRFSRYRVPRFRDLPEMDVVLVDRKDLPSAGAGEIPIVAVAPAVANAIAAATGRRLRSLPLVPDGEVSRRGAEDAEGEEKG